MQWFDLQQFVADQKPGRGLRVCRGNYVCRWLKSDPQASALRVHRALRIEKEGRRGSR